MKEIKNTNSNNEDIFMSQEAYCAEHVQNLLNCAMKEENILGDKAFFLIDVAQKLSCVARDANFSSSLSENAGKVQEILQYVTQSDRIVSKETSELMNAAQIILSCSLGNYRATQQHVQTEMYPQTEMYHVLLDMISQLNETYFDELLDASESDAAKKASDNEKAKKELDTIIKILKFINASSTPLPY